MIANTRVKQEQINCFDAFCDPSRVFKEKTILKDKITFPWKRS